MCSTPKPKRSSQGKALASSTSILASMNRAQRQTFSERANIASKRREEKVKITKFNDIHFAKVSSALAHKKPIKNKMRTLGFIGFYQRLLLSYLKKWCFAINDSE